MGTPRPSLSIAAESTKARCTEALYLRAGWNADGRWAMRPGVNHGFPYPVPPVPTTLTLIPGQLLEAVGSTRMTTGAVYDQTHQRIPRPTTGPAGILAWLPSALLA